MERRYGVHLDQFFDVHVVVTTIGYECRVLVVEERTEPLRVGVFRLRRFLLGLVLVGVLLFLLGVLLVPSLGGKVGPVTVTFATAFLATALGTRPSRGGIVRRTRLPGAATTVTMVRARLEGSR